MWEGLTQIQLIQQKILFVKFVGFVFFLICHKFKPSENLWEL